MSSPVIFEIANWKVQIENFIFPIFIFQLFFTFYESGNIASHLEARAPLQVRDKHAPLAQVQSAHDCVQYFLQKEREP